MARGRKLTIQKNITWSILLPMLAFGIYEELRMLIYFLLAPTQQEQMKMLFDMYATSFSLAITVIIVIAVFWIRKHDYRDMREMSRSCRNY